MLEREVSRREFLVLSCAGAFVLSGIVLEGCADKQSDTASDPRLAAEPATDSALVEEAIAPPVPTPDEILESRVEELLAGMSLEHKVAQLFIVSPESLVNLEDVSYAGELTREALVRYPVGGVVYFSGNLFDAGQTSDMLAATTSFSLASNGIPPFLCVDEEGGSVARIGGNEGFDVDYVGDMAEIGLYDDVDLARETATIIAGYLKPLGFNVDFAPVCDIANNPYSDVMSLRSFGSDPYQVARMAQAQVEGFQASGILCCAKHFPGIGSAAGDSHMDAIVASNSIEELRATELVPFASAIQAGVPFVMVGHVAVPNVTGDYAPASLSPFVIQTLLREELGFQGLVITDALGMGAVSLQYGADESAVLALLAGCDIVLMPPDFETAFHSVLAAVEAGVIGIERVDESVSRILRTKLQSMEDLFAFGEE